MNKLFTKIAAACVTAAMAVGVGVAVSFGTKNATPVNAAPGSSPMTSTFNSKSWGVSSGDSWTSDSDGYQYSSGHVQVTAGVSGAGCTSDETYPNISKISVRASTTSKGVGNITIKVGSGTAQTICSLSKQQTADDYELTYSPAVSGQVSLVVNCSTNSMYLDSITITYAATSPSISVESTASVAKDESTNLTVSYANMASGLTISGESDDTDVATVTASQTTTGASGTATFTANGLSQGTATLTFSVTYSGNTYSKTCTLSVTEEYRFAKITKVAELNTSRVGGGRYIISSSANNSMVMSTTQNSNNRANTTATIESGEMVVAIPTTIAVLNIEKSGNYYTLYDSVNDGYLYAVGTSNYLRTSNPEPLTDYFYWTITFNSNHAVITNKANSFVIRVNTGNNPPIFSTYNGTQTAIDLYEMVSDIPASTDLSSITVENASVSDGSTIVYSGTYSPANATEGIEVTLSSDIATLGAVSMNNGEFSLSIKGKSVGSATLTFVGEDGHASTTATLTVTAFVATHNLVTSVSSLSNGARVAIGSPSAEENTNYSASAHTGGDYLPVADTGYNSTKTALQAASSTQEFIVWCVDSTNGYYILSSDGFYLESAAATNNYLQRTDVLNERCLFTISDDSSGIILTSVYAANHEWKYQEQIVDYTLQYNYNGGTNSRFSLYRAESQKAASLYLSTDSLNAVQGFVDVFMHLSNYTAELDYCKDSEHHYYSDAKSAYNSLTSAQKEAFCTESAYATAYDRLCHWAFANNDTFDNSYDLVAAQSVSIFSAMNSETSTAIIVVIAVASVSAIGAIFFIRRRKYN